jgi:aspartyl-tRNA(Asn)/glutamyl-tRNA(Gln) amidotransferase subunit C
LNILEEREGKRNVEITKQEVEKVAKLARLELTDIEKAAFAKQLSQILTHVETLKQYDTTGVEPTATVLGQVNVLRPDIARPSLSVERAVANAPESADGFFVVPKIIEDRQPI